MILNGNIKDFLEFSQILSKKFLELLSKCPFPFRIFFQFLFHVLIFLTQFFFPFIKISYTSVDHFEMSFDSFFTSFYPTYIPLVFRVAVTSLAGTRAVAARGSSNAIVAIAKGRGDFTLCRTST